MVLRFSHGQGQRRGRPRTEQERQEEVRRRPAPGSRKADRAQAPEAEGWEEVSKYELDDDAVRMLLRNPDRLPRALAQALQEQTPPIEPTKAGSIAVTDDGREFVRWCNGTSHTSSPWLDTMQHGEDFYRWDQITSLKVIDTKEGPG